MKLASTSPVVASLLATSLGLFACGNAGNPTGAGVMAGAGSPAAGGDGQYMTNGGGGSAGLGGASPVGGAMTGGGNAPVGGGHSASPSGDGIVPLFSDMTTLEHPIHYETADAIVTRWSDRGRDRHSREAKFQSYD